MKSLISFSMLFVLAGGFSLANAASAPGTKEVTIAVNDVFVPEVVSRGTDAKIILSGMLPNSCYSWSRSLVTSSNETNHEIKAKAFVTTNTMCLMVLVPYSKEVNLGQLAVGEHTLRFSGLDDTYFERKLVVE